MKEIDLRELYPDIYDVPSKIMVDDKVVDAITECENAEKAYRRKMYRHHAQYSLDREDGIENETLKIPLTPYEIMEASYTKDFILAAIHSLPEKQAVRIYAYFYMGLTIPQIAEMEKVSKSRVSESISRGISNLKKLLKDNI